MVGIALKDRAQTILAHQIAVLALNRENDVRTKMIAGCIFNRKFAFAVAFPLCSSIGRITGFTGNNGYFDKKIELLESELVKMKSLEVDNLGNKDKKKGSHDKQ